MTVEIIIGVNNKEERGIVKLTTDETDIDILYKEITKAKLLYAHLKAIESLEKAKKAVSGLNSKLP